MRVIDNRPSLNEPQTKRSTGILSLLLCLAVFGANAQEADKGQSTLTVHSTLVEVPALIKLKDGQIVFQLTGEDFVLTDNGIAQHLTLDQDTDSQPLALAICVETGGAGARHLTEYGQLDSIFDALLGNAEHRVAVIGFDSTPKLLVPFTSNIAAASQQLANLHEGDHGAAILDAVAFAVTQLQMQPVRYRRAVLLISETIDGGSETNLKDALRLISDTNTVMYSFGFSSTRSAVHHEASKFNRPDEPGPEHGCFSRDGADAGYEGHYNKQVLDCLSDLAPPIRLATMTFVTARNALRTNTAQSVAELTGGEFFHFHNAKDLSAGIIALSSDVPNYYRLSFRPTDLTPGLHSLHLEVRNRPKFVLKSRSEYWIETDVVRSH